VPQEGDLVLGIVAERVGEGFAVDIRGPCHAQLHETAFEGATKRNKPAIATGDVIYCRVTEAHRDLEPEVACVDEAGRAAGFGLLRGGTIVAISTGLARRLLSNPPFPPLVALGERTRFEIAVGLNGRVWIGAPSPGAVAAVSQLLGAAGELSDAAGCDLARALIEILRRDDDDT